MPKRYLNKYRKSVNTIKTCSLQVIKKILQCCCWNQDIPGELCECNACWWSGSFRGRLSEAIADFRVLTDKVWIELYMSTHADGWSHPGHYPVPPSMPPCSQKVNVMVMNGWLNFLSNHINRHSHSWDKAISNCGPQTSRSWVWSKGKVMYSS